MLNFVKKLFNSSAKTKEYHPIPTALIEAEFIQERLKMEELKKQYIDSGDLSYLPLKTYMNWVIDNLDYKMLPHIHYVDFDISVLKVNSNYINLPPLYGASAENFFVPIGIYFYASGHSSVYYEDGRYKGTIWVPEEYRSLISFKLRGGVI